MAAVMPDPRLPSQPLNVTPTDRYQITLLDDDRVTGL